MSNRVIDIILKAKDEASGVVKKAGDSITNMGSTIKKGMAVAATAAAVAGTALIAFGKSAVTEAQNQIRVNTQLETVLKSTGGTVGYTAKEIGNMANAMQKQYAIADDVIQQGQNMLLTFTNIRGEVFEKSTVAILDMATAMNGGLTPSAEQLSAQAIQLGKALNDPINGISSLSRVGVTFTEQQKSQIKGFMDQNDVMSAQKIILEELSKEFGGSAAAQALEYEGKMRLLSLAIGDVKESIGTGLITVLTKLYDRNKETIDQWSTNITKWAENEENINKLSTALEGLGIALSIVAQVMTVTWNALTSFGDWLANAIASWIYHFQNFKTSASDAWQGLKDTVNSVIDGIVGAWDAAVGKIMAAVEKVKIAFNSVKQGVSNIGGSIKGGATNAYNSVAGIFRAAGGEVTPGSSYIVGENGAERFVPSVPGYIMPNQSGGLTIGSLIGGNVNVYNEADENRLIRKIDEMLERRVSLGKRGVY